MNSTEGDFYSPDLNHNDLNSTEADFYSPDQWFLNLSGFLGLLTVTTNLAALIRALKVRNFPIGVPI